MQNNEQQRRGGRKPQGGGGRGKGRGGGAGGGAGSGAGSGAGGGAGGGAKGGSSRGNNTNRGFGRGQGPVASKKSSDAPRSREEQFKLLEKQREEQRKLQQEEAAKSAKNNPKSSAAAHADESDEEEPYCLVCCEPMHYVSIGECNHPVACALCTTRMRLLHNDRRCVMCKHDLERVFVTVDLKKKYEDFQTWGDVAGPGLAFDSVTGMFFEETFGGIDHMREIESLRELRCGAEGCINPGPFSSVAKLKAHLLEMHNLHLCKLCWESRGVFPMEQKLYTKAELDKHCTDGEPGTAFRGHPLCRFCKNRWYNQDDLYAHLKEKHESCHICLRQGKPYEYYRNYDNLYKHFVKAHYVCTEPECVEAKFNVYASELELRGHIVKNHPHVRIDRSLPVHFDFGSRSGESSRRNENEIDSFSFQYMPNTAGHPTMINQDPVAAPSFDDSAFPTLGDNGSSPTGGATGATSRHYQNVVGSNSRSVLGDSSHFPSLGPSPSSSGRIHNVRQGQDFSNAVSMPYTNLNNNQFVQMKKSQGKKKKKGGKNTEDDFPRPVVMSADEEARATMRMSTQQSSVPAAYPVPAPAPVARGPSNWGGRAQPQPQPQPQRGFADRHTPGGLRAQDGSQWDRPKGPSQNRGSEDFPSLPPSAGPTGGRGATSATAQWDALRASNKIKTGVTLGSRPKAQQKKKKPKAKKPEDDVFNFTGR